MASGLLTLSPGLTALPPSLSPTGRLSCRRGPGCSSLSKASCAWQLLAWPCRWPSAFSHRCQRSVGQGLKGRMGGDSLAIINKYLFSAASLALG